MKSFSVFLVFFLAALTAVAQMDTNPVAAHVGANASIVPANTNAPAAASATNGVAVQTDTNTIVAQVKTNASATQPGTNTVAVQTNAMATAVPVGTNAATRAMSLTDCFQEALQHNFDVQIERYSPQVSLYDLRSAYGGYDPLFNISGQHNYNKSGVDGVPPTISDGNSFKSDLGGSLPWGLQYDFSGNISEQYGLVPSGLSSSTNFDNSGGTIGVQLTQPLLKNFWIDNTRLTIRVAKNRLKYSEQGLRLQVITSITDVENAYYELIYARENVKVQQEALDLAQTQLDQDRQRVQIGTLAQLDVQQDEAQVAQSRANLIAAQSTFNTAQNTLKNLLTDQYSRWHDLDIQPTATITNAPLQLFDLQDSWSKGMTERPDLLQARLNVEKQGIQLKFDRNQLFPELDLTGTYGFNGAAREFSGVFNQFNEGDRPFYSYGAQLSIPLSNVKARNTVKSDKATLQQLLLTLKQFEQKVMVQIDNAVKQAQSDYQSVAATRQARIYAEAALDAEQKKYAVGKSTTFTVLQLQNTLTADRGQEIRALANYYKDLANLAQQEGSTLERNRINLEAK
ncbi:MAG: TolC family protein [Verrucomicrobiota bacterium]|jgi:outer membrane protein TolC